MSSFLDRPSVVAGVAPSAAFGKSFPTPYSGVTNVPWVYMGATPGRYPDRLAAAAAGPQAAAMMIPVGVAQSAWSGGSAGVEGMALIGTVDPRTGAAPSLDVYGATAARFALPGPRPLPPKMPSASIPIGARVSVPSWALEQPGNPNESMGYPAGGLQADAAARKAVAASMRANTVAVRVRGRAISGLRGPLAMPEGELVIDRRNPYLTAQWMLPVPAANAGGVVASQTGDWQTVEPSPLIEALAVAPKGALGGLRAIDAPSPAMQVFGTVYFAFGLVGAAIAYDHAKKGKKSKALWTIGGFLAPWLTTGIVLGQRSKRTKRSKR